jgi:Domain of unknown function (DUF4783)
MYRFGVLIVYQQVSFAIPDSFNTTSIISHRLKPLIHSASIVLLLLSAPVPVARAQPVDDILRTIEKMISTEDVAGLVSIASDPLDIAVFGPTQTFSHTQGTFVIDDLFDDVDVRAFTITDYTESVNGLFIEGLIQVPRSDHPVRLFIRLKKSAQKWSVRELLFERDDRQP